MRISSPAFEDGERIPEKHGYKEENTSPPLEIRDVPEEAESLVLIVDDPDAMEPAGQIWDHWIMFNIGTGISRIDEDSSPGIEGENSYGEKGYGGPNPPDGEHNYVFRLYALDAELDIDEDVSREVVESAMEEHILEEAQLEGTYAP